MGLLLCTMNIRHQDWLYLLFEMYEVGHVLLTCHSSALPRSSIPHAIVRMEVECCSDVELTSIPTGNLLTANDFLQVLHQISFSFSTEPTP